MTWLLAWVAVPLLTLLLCVGLGLLVERVLSVRLALAVSVGTGFAALVVLTTLLTEFTATARWTTAVVSGLALAGWALGGRRLLARPRWWSGVAAVATYVVYALPVALAGVTWAGFIKLDDTPVWMAFADRLVTVGHTTENLPHSTYGQVLVSNWDQGYPVGAFGHLGVVAQLAHIDIAWVVQPLMAVIAAMLAWTLYALTDGVVRSRALRAAVSVLGASSALLFGYVMWGGFKEVILAALLAIACLAVTQGSRDQQGPWAHGVLLALPLAAIFVVFGLAGAVYIAPIAVAELVLMFRNAGARDTARAAGAFLVTFLLLSIPELRSLREQVSQLSKASLMSSEDIGNLILPVKFIQVFGIWPTGDFRVTPQPLLLTTLLVGMVAVTAIAGVGVALRARRPRLPLYVGVAILVAVYSVFGNAWLEGKALAISSPAMLLAAGVGCAWLMENRLRVVGLVLGADGSGVCSSSTDDGASALTDA